MRERASKVDRLEAELNRYKDKLNDIDYYKARLEELREDNRLLEETKSILEGQLENAHQRTDLVLDLEGELLNYKSQLNNLLAEKEADKERIKKLVEENAHWQLCTKNCLSESASLVAELDSLRTHNASPNKDSLGQQMSTADLQANLSSIHRFIHQESIGSWKLSVLINLGVEWMINGLVPIVGLQAKTRRLEMENQRLVSLLSNMKEAHFRENAERILQLEDENTRLKLKVEDLEDDQRGKEGKMSEVIDAVSSRAAQAEKKNLDLQRTQQEQKNTIEALKANSTIYHLTLLNSIY